MYRRAFYISIKIITPFLKLILALHSYCHYITKILALRFNVGEIIKSTILSHDYTILGIWMLKSNGAIYIRTTETCHLSI